MKKLLVLLLALLLILSGCSTAATTAPTKTATIKASAASQEATVSIDEIKNSIKIHFIHVSTPNSAGGVNFEVSFDNLSKKTINYITFYVQPINSVGDPVKDEISGASKKKCRLTGPVKPGESGRGLFDCVWYNVTISTVNLIEVTIEYGDDTVLKIPTSAVLQLDYETK